MKRAEERGIARNEILHAAQSLYHDVAPANSLGLKSAWINRRFDKPGFGATTPSDAKPLFTVNSMADLARKLIPEGPENSSI